MNDQSTQQKTAIPWAGIVFFSLSALSVVYVLLTRNAAAPPASGRVVSPQPGDPSPRGGSPHVRRPFVAQEDDASTTNDESNDQPVGYFGSTTLHAYSHSAGHSYDLDADIEDNYLQRLYFPKGGWIDFHDCELDDSLQGECVDEEGRSWRLEGES